VRDERGRAVRSDAGWHLIRARNLSATDSAELTTGVAGVWSHLTEAAGGSCCRLTGADRVGLETGLMCGMSGGGRSGKMLDGALMAPGGVTSLLHLISQKVFIQSLCKSQFPH
jgi:hypothetical protein